MYMGRGFLAVDQGDDVWVMQPFEYVDLGVEVLFELLVKLVQVDRLDGHITGLLLPDMADVSKAILDGKGFIWKTSCTTNAKSDNVRKTLLSRGDRPDRCLPSMKPCRRLQSSLDRSPPTF